MTEPLPPQWQAVGNALARLLMEAGAPATVDWGPSEHDMRLNQLGVLDWSEMRWDVVVTLPVVPLASIQTYRQTVQAAREGWPPDGLAPTISR